MFYNITCISGYIYYINRYDSSLCKIMNIFQNSVFNDKINIIIFQPGLISRYLRKCVFYRICFPCALAMFFCLYSVGGFYRNSLLVQEVDFYNQRFIIRYNTYILKRSYIY